MKKLKSILLVVMAAILTLGCLTACGGGNSSSSSSTSSTSSQPEANKFETYSSSKFQAEDFSSKTISKQLTGEWALVEYSMYFNFSFNMYTDGSVRVEQRNTRSMSSYYYYGYWNENDGEDGKELEIATKYMTNLDGGLSKEEWEIVAMAQSDGTYAFNFNFCMAPGQYRREAALTGGTAITYATEEEFHTAVDVIEVKNEYKGVLVESEGMSIVVKFMSNNTLGGSILTQYNGQEVALADVTGTWGYAFADGAVTGIDIKVSASSKSVENYFGAPIEETIAAINGSNLPSTFTLEGTFSMQGQSFPFASVLTQQTAE